MAGQKFDTPEVSNTPLIHYLLTHTAMAGRPGAGPALALSLVLVAIVCVFTGLCYAELASMIPIAGSAYTYTYATLGELVAWIIGWDLILEYAFSNMSVSVGFAAHIEAICSSGSACTRRSSGSRPPTCPPACRIWPATTSTHPGWHFGFNIPAFLVVMVLTVILVRGIRESARTNNILVLVKIVAILVFIFAGASFIKPRLLASLHAQRLDRHALRRLDHLLHLHRIRLRLHRRRGVQAAAARSALRHPRHAGRLHRALWRSRHLPQRHRALAVDHGRRRAGGERAQAPLAPARRRTTCTGSSWSCSSAPCWA